MEKKKKYPPISVLSALPICGYDLGRLTGGGGHQWWRSMRNVVLEILPGAAPVVCLCVVTDPSQSPARSVWSVGQWEVDFGEDNVKIACIQNISPHKVVFKMLEENKYWEMRWRTAEKEKNIIWKGKTVNKY